MAERYVVIMAGGSGTRFWPASRRRLPKQFLTIGGDRSLLRLTAQRVADEVGWDNLIVVTGSVHADHAKLELPELPEENILIEPAGRNTAPCIGWANQVILDRSPDATVAVLPADHYIADNDDFLAHMRAAMIAAEEQKRIVLLGLVPTRPETGYGYIKKGEGDSVVEDLGKDVFGVGAFVEKPDRETAETYLADGGYYWNSGMFIFPAQVMAEEITTHLPELAEGLKTLKEKPTRLKKLYPELPSISIDYGIMEKASGVLVIPSTFPWSDVGSWDAAHEVYPRDENNNVALGDALLINSNNCLIDARASRLVAIVDADDLIVVDTTDAVLIAPRGKSQAVKKVVEALANDEREELL